MLMGRLLQIVAAPRQFVLLDTYFDPDRRRRPSAPPEGRERRVMKQEDIEVIHDDS